MNKGYILDNKIEEEHNKYLFEIEKGKFIHVKELLLAFESLQKQLEDLVKQLQEAYKEIDRLNNIINEAIEKIEIYSKDWDTDIEGRYYEWEKGLEKDETREILNILELKEGNKDD